MAISEHIIVLAAINPYSWRSNKNWCLIASAQHWWLHDLRALSVPQWLEQDRQYKWAAFAQSKTKEPLRQAKNCQSLRCTISSLPRFVISLCFAFWSTLTTIVCTQSMVLPELFWGGRYLLKNCVLSWLSTLWWPMKKVLYAFSYIHKTVIRLRMHPSKRYWLSKYAY